MKPIFQDIHVGPEITLSGVIDDAGVAHVAAEYMGAAGVKVRLEVSGSPRLALDELKALIPGKVDDAIISAGEDFFGL